MAEQDCLTEPFEKNRAHLQAVAYRMLGSQTEAEDAVQEAWLRLSRSDTSGVENLGGWLTTVVARVCLDMLRSRKSRREDALSDDDLGAKQDAATTNLDDGLEPERGALLADSVALALLVVLETLAPAERVAFVLHDMFDLSFDEIAPIVGRSPDAARQLASRARRRVQGAPAAPDADLTGQRKVVDAFLAASRGGDLAALLALLDPDVIFRADRAAVETSASNQAKGAPKLEAELRGAARVAGAFAGRAGAAQPALVDGAVGAVWAPGGRTRGVFRFTIAGGKIVGIDLALDPARVAELEVTFLGE